MSLNEKAEQLLLKVIQLEQSLERMKALANKILSKHIRPSGEILALSNAKKQKIIDDYLTEKARFQSLGTELP